MTKPSCCATRGFLLAELQACFLSSLCCLLVSLFSFFFSFFLFYTVFYFFFLAFFFFPLSYSSLFPSVLSIQILTVRHKTLFFFPWLLILLHCLTGCHLDSVLLTFHFVSSVSARRLMPFFVFSETPSFECVQFVPFFFLELQEANRQAKTGTLQYLVFAMCFVVS